MPREPGAIVVRIIVAKVVEQQERIGVIRFAKTKRAAQLHASPFDGGLGFDHSSDGADRHRTSAAEGSLTRRDVNILPEGVTR